MRERYREKSAEVRKLQSKIMVSWSVICVHLLRFWAFSINRKILEISLEISIRLKTCFIWHNFHSFPGFPRRLHSRAILRAKIKDMAANSLELVKLVNGTQISIGKFFQRKNRTTFSDVFYLLSSRYFRNLLVNGKRPFVKLYILHHKPI